MMKHYIKIEDGRIVDHAPETAKHEGDGWTEIDPAKLKAPLNDIIIAKIHVSVIDGIVQHGDIPPRPEPVDRLSALISELKKRGIIAQEWGKE